MRRYLCIVTVCIMILSFFTGCSSGKFGLEDEESYPASSIALSEAEAEILSDKTPLLLYFPNEDFSKLKLEIRYIPMSEAKSVNRLAEIIVNELIKGPKVPGLKSSIPQETKLHSKIIIDGEVATVDFSKEFRDNHPDGKAQETMTIYSIVNSLTELKEINKVKFLIEGKSCPEFKGNFKFNKTFPRSTQLISKKTEPAATGSQNPSEEEKNRSKDSTDSKNEDSKSNDSKKDDKENTKDTSADAIEENIETFEETGETFEEAVETFEEDFNRTFIDFE